MVSGSSRDPYAYSNGDLSITHHSFSVTRADGSDGFVQVPSGPIKQEEHVIGAVTVWHDITELKKSEEALHTREKQFRNAFENSAVAMALTASDGKLLMVNTAFYQLVGYSKTELTELKFIDITHPDDLLVNLEGLKSLASGEITNYRLEKRYIHKDGRVIWVDMSTSTLLDIQGNLSYFVTQAQDITERKRAEREARELMTAVQEEKDKLSALVNSISDEIWFASLNGDFTLANPSAVKEFALDSPDGIGVADLAKSLEVYRPDGSARPVEEAPPLRALTGEVVRNQEEMIRTPAKGELRYRQVSSNPVRNTNGQIIGSVSVVRDITERKQAEMALKEQTQQLEDANKELESFSYSVSHDLKAPLRAIEGYSRMLLKKDAFNLSKDTIRKLEVIRSNTERMNALIDDLLAFSKVLKSSIAISEINMDKLVREVWTEIQMANTERELEVKITNMLPGKGDPTLVRQILVNLLSNAVKFTKTRTPGIIEVSCHSENDVIVYWVKDNGVGFDMAYYEKLFSVFQRLHSHDEYEGTGVGLAIVHRIINRHGGRIWAEGEVDKGATFFFTLPQKEDISN